MRDDHYRHGAQISHITTGLGQEDTPHDVDDDCACWCDPWIYIHDDRVTVLHRAADDDDSEPPVITRFAVN